MNTANSMFVGAHEPREAAIAVCLTHRHRCLAGLVSSYRKSISSFFLLTLLSLAPLAQAFDLQQLSDQLAKPAVVRGQFLQEKHLRALPAPLISKGQFVLARDFGLLWLLQTPLKQDYRINAVGIARRDPSVPGGWQLLPGKSAGAEQNRLFLAVLQGDSSGFQGDFELAATGLSADQH
jgi:hypothetical protein